jgi:hypothetical protein
MTVGECKMDCLTKNETLVAAFKAVTTIEADEAVACLIIWQSVNARWIFLLPLESHLYLPDSIITVDVNTHGRSSVLPH